MMISILRTLVLLPSVAGAVTVNTGEVRLVPETLAPRLAVGPTLTRPALSAPALSPSLSAPSVKPALSAPKPAEEKELIANHLPPIIADELDVVAPKLRSAPLGAREREEVLGMTGFKAIRWYHHFINDITPVPDGVTYPDNRILMSVRKGWRDYPSYEDHFRVLFAHEYTHRLQNEGLITTKYGVEIPAVATELLRAVELVGVEGIHEGRIRFIGEGVLGHFDEGRRWAHSDRTKIDGFYFKGQLGGAAFELAHMTGRWDDAWEFLRRVASGPAPEPPAAVFADIASRNDR